MNEFKIGDRVYYEYVGAGDKTIKHYGEVTDIFGPYLDIRFGRQLISWPVRAELVHPDDGNGKPEVKHVLC